MFFHSPIFGQIKLFLLPEQDKIKFATDFISVNFKIDKSKVPTIKIENELIREKGSTVLGMYDSKKNIISLLPDAFANLGILESTLVHEMYHYKIHESGSVELDKRLNELKPKIVKRFDIGEIEHQIKKHNLDFNDIIEMVVSLAEKPLEEIIVSELTLKFNNYQDYNNAIESEKKALLNSKKRFEDFLNSPKEFYLSGEVIILNPKGTK